MTLSELRGIVFRRDRQCLAAKMDLSHRCRDKWGNAHLSTDLDYLTLEHVKDEAMMGRKAPDDEWHTVALCHSANAVTHWGSANRQRLRDYLAGVRTDPRYIPPAARQRMADEASL